jgi:hypothetical protein
MLGQFPLTGSVSIVPLTRAGRIGLCNFAAAM